MRAQTFARGAALAGLMLLSLILLPAMLADGVRAEDPAAFFKGRDINMQIGYSAGGGYDVYARTTARLIGKHTGPEIENLLKEVHQTPPAIAAKAARALNPK